MSAIQTLKNGNFQARVRKKGKDSSQVFSSLADAKAWAKKEEARIEKAISGREGSINVNTFTVGEALLLFFENHAKDLKSATEVRIVLEKLPNFLIRERLNSMTREAPARWLEDMKELNPATIHRRVGIIRAGVNYCIKHEPGLSGVVNVFSSLKLPKLLSSSSRERIATDEELKALKAHTGTRSKFLADFLELATETACRRGELVTLKFSNVDFSRSIARLFDTKNGEDRDVPLSERAIEILKKRKAEANSDYVFSSSQKSANGRHIQPASISLAFRRVREKIEKETGMVMDLRLHDIRHTSATKWSKDFDIFELKKITGHKDIRSLQRYVNPPAVDIAQKMKGLKTLASYAPTMLVNS